VVSGWKYGSAVEYDYGINSYKIGYLDYLLVQYVINNNNNNNNVTLSQFTGIFGPTFYNLLLKHIFVITYN